MEERIAVREYQHQTRQVVSNMLPTHIALNFVDFTGFKRPLVSNHAHLKYTCTNDYGKTLFLSSEHVCALVPERRSVFCDHP